MSIQAGCWRDPLRQSEHQLCGTTAGSRDPEQQPSGDTTLAAVVRCRRRWLELVVEEESDITVSKVVSI